MTTEDAMEILETIRPQSNCCENCANSMLKAEARVRTLTLACEATLLFHSSEWRAPQIIRWEEICMALGRTSANEIKHESNTKQLCNIVRAAMERPE